jgi:cation:H+ antiporter
VNRQGWIQLGAGVLLVVGCLPVGAMGSVFQTGGRLSQPMGFVFLVLLVLYLWQAVRWSRAGQYVVIPDDIDPSQAPTTGRIVVKLILGVVLVVGSSWVLIPAVREAALRLYIPQSVIAATLVAFGTSLPELVTSVTAARRGHGEIAVGNIIGADILNVLFVAGASASVTAGGLLASPYFFRFLFPAMLAVLVMFRIGIRLSGTTMRRPFGVVLIAIYLVVTGLSYLLSSQY